MTPPNKAQVPCKEYDGFAFYVRTYHSAEPEDFEPTDVPCYWRRKVPCGGLRGGCLEPLHTCIGNAGPTQHTVCYRDPCRKADGRWTSPAATWRKHREGHRDEQSE